MFSLTSVFNFQAYKLTGFTVTFFSLDSSLVILERLALNSEIQLTLPPKDWH